jgi:glutathione S-transferase
MKLIGLLDSPFVRRVAISLQVLGLRFEHEPVSVFRGYAAFERINPVVRAPTLVCDDGEVLMDSTLILEYAQALARPRSLMPADVPALQHALRAIGLALAACDKTAQIVYERGLRPPEKLHEPWIERVTAQLLAAYGALEAEVARRPPALARGAMSQAGICAAVAWHFTQQMLPGVVDAAAHPALVALSTRAETLPEFRAAPYGEGRVQFDADRA